MPTTLITEASSGIGIEHAKQFGARGKFVELPVDRLTDMLMVSQRQRAHTANSQSAARDALT